MCGRFNLVTPDLDELRRYLPIDEIDVDRWNPRYNIAPSQLAPVLHVTDNGSTRISLMGWGLLSKQLEARGHERPINARVETLGMRRAFRDLLGSRQCIVPATGYYEWRSTAGGKQPWLIAPPSGILAMAGLWDRWISRQGEVVETFAVITADAAPQIANIHDRMPLLIEPSGVRMWLQGGRPPMDPFTKPARSLTAIAISSRVSSPVNDDPAVLQPAEIVTESQLSLGLDSPSPRPPSRK